MAFNPGPSQLVLISGINGFVGSVVAKHFLDAGYSVRGTVRNQAKADATLEVPVFKAAAHAGKLEIVLVEEITADGAFDDALRNVDYFCHTASPLVGRTGHQKDNEHDLLLPALQGTLTALHSSAKSPQLRKFILLSSMVAVVDYTAPSQAGVIYNESHWNALSYEAAKTAPPYLAYAVSKTIAEKAMWDFAEKEKPSFKVVSLNPTCNYGESFAPMDPDAPFLGPNVGTNDFVAAILLDPKYDFATGQGYPNFVDVRDTARAHVLAVQNEAADGHRFILTAPRFHPVDYPSLIVAGAPELARRVPTPPKDFVPEDTYTLDATASKEILGLEYHTPEQTLGDTARWIVKVAEGFA